MSGSLVLKNILDTLGSVLLICLLLPAFLLIAAAIVCESGGPVLYVQERGGKYGRPFWIFKFRTMVPDAENYGAGFSVSKDDNRITRVGRCLREWSLDELPQLFNILKGDMSFVGPRPTLLYQIEQYTAEQRKRLRMKPGITGLAQVRGRNNLSWPEKIRYDIVYVENYSLRLDASILLETVRVVLSRRGTYRENEAADGRGDEIDRLF